MSTLKDAFPSQCRLFDGILDTIPEAQVRGLGSKFRNYAYIKPMAIIIDRTIPVYIIVYAFIALFLS